MTKEKMGTLMEVHAAQDVAGSTLLLDTFTQKDLIDCGNLYGRDDEGRSESGVTFPFDPKTIDHLVFTHFHDDHFGRTLDLRKQGFHGPQYGVPAGVEIGLIQAKQKIASPFIYNKSVKGKRYAGGPRKGQFVSFKPIEFQKPDLDEMMNSFVKTNDSPGIPYKTPFNLGNNITATYYEAGHIPGSAQILFDIKKNEKKVRVLTAFDLGRTDYKNLGRPISDIPILKYPETNLPGDIDYIVVEATYGGKTHKDIQESVNLLEKLSWETHDKKGVNLNPAFSIMRTHMLLNFYFNLYKAGKLPKDLALVMSSPMAEQVSKVILKYHADMDEQALKQFQESDDCPFYFGQLTHHDKWAKTQTLFDDPKTSRPFVLIGSSGMLEGGRIMKALPYVLPDKDSMVTLSGYQAGNTTGAKLLNGAKEITLFDQVIPVNCKVTQLGGLSCHVDFNENYAHVKHVAPNATVLIKHGEKENCEALRQGFIKNGWNPSKVIVMEKMQTYDLISKD